MKINNYVWENDLSLNDLVLKQKEEIDRLNKSLDVATEMINNKQKEIVRLNNIIKEVREYINNKNIEPFTKEDLLEILDKGE